MTGLEVKDWEKNIALKGHCPQIPNQVKTVFRSPRNPLSSPPYLTACSSPIPPLRPQVDGLKARLSSIVSVVAIPSLLPPHFGGGTAAGVAPPPLLLPWTATASSSAASPLQAGAAEPPAMAEAEISGAIARALGEVQAMVRRRGELGGGREGLPPAQGGTGKGHRLGHVEGGGVWRGGRGQLSRPSGGEDLHTFLTLFSTRSVAWASWRLAIGSSRAA